MYRSTVLSWFTVPISSLSHFEREFLPRSLLYLIPLIILWRESKYRIFSDVQYARNFFKKLKCINSFNVI